MRGQRIPRWILGILAIAAPLRAEDPPADTEPAAETEAAAPEPEARLARDYQFLDRDLIRNKDGSLTWWYVTNHVASTHLKDAIDKLGLNGVRCDTRKRDTFRLTWNPAPDRRRYEEVEPIPRETVTDENLLILTFPAPYRDILEEFLDRFDVPIPQVYIKARIVEVTLDSNLEYGVSLFFDKGKATAQNPSTFFRSFRTGFRPPSFTAPFLSEGNLGIGIKLDNVSLDEAALTAQIEALQERGEANILSEPSIIAMQGHRATLITGQETPVFELTVRGASDTISTKFKETGIRLDFVPLHIGREYVKLRVRPEVSSITGFITTAGTTTVQNPIIAQRNAETVVTVRDGMTLVIGGLYSISEITDKAGVPVLGSIPVLKYLFSRTQTTKVKSELDFFITPHILRTRLDKRVFVPPMEKERLRRKAGEKEPKKR